MIVENGNIRLKYLQNRTAQGGTVETVVVYGNAIPCQYRPVGQDRTAENGGGHYVSVGYEILIESRSVSAPELQLSDINDSPIGEYAIVSIEKLQVVGLVKIMVESCR